MLKEQNRLAGRQMKFILGVRDESVALAELMRRQGLTPVLVKRWFRRRFFRRALGGATGEKNRVLLGAELVLLRAAAWQWLRDMIDGKASIDEARIKLCTAVISMADVELRRARSRAVGRRKREKRHDEPRDLVHPNAAAEADQLLAEMEATAAAAILQAREAREAGGRRAGEDAGPPRAAEGAGGALQIEECGARTAS